MFSCRHPYLTVRTAGEVPVLSSLVSRGRLRHILAVSLRFIIYSGFVILAGSLSAAPLRLDFLKVGSRVYSNITVVGANTTDLYFTYNQGIANVKLKYVDESLRKRFNYDPKSAAEAEKQQDAQDAAYRDSLVAVMVAQAQKAALAAKKAASTSEDSLADPISEKSLLGKPAPALDAEKWLSDKPTIKGKFALIAFWEPRSSPSKKFIPQFNALQKKFGEKLTVVGLTSDTEEEIEKMDQPRLEFASGIDTKARMVANAGVSYVPYVLFLDDKGIVRYQGHPGALDEKKIETLLAKVAD